LTHAVAAGYRRKARKLSTSLSGGTFISKHFTVDPDEFRRVIDSMKTDVRDCNGGIEVKVCKLCTKGNKDNMGNLWKLRVHKDGRFYCFRYSNVYFYHPPLCICLLRSLVGIRCSLGGSWFDLKRRCSGGVDLFIHDTSSKPDDPKTSITSVPSAQSITYDKLTYLAREGNLQDEDIRRFLSVTRGLDLDVCVRYGVGYSLQKYRDDNSGEWIDELCVTFPWYPMSCIISYTEMSYLIAKEIYYSQGSLLREI
jgi:hypothetical protein